MTFSTLYKIISENKSSSYNYIGNCTNLFDPDDGVCYTNHFSDISEFAYHAELAEDDLELEDRNGNGEMFEDDFDVFVKDKSMLPSNHSYRYFYYSNGLLVAYDVDEDIHYFFSK
jgi:hypothetical protein